MIYIALVKDTGKWNVFEQVAFKKEKSQMLIINTDQKEILFEHINSDSVKNVYSVKELSDFCEVSGLNPSEMNANSWQNKINNLPIEEIVRINKVYENK